MFPTSIYGAFEIDFSTFGHLADAFPIFLLPNVPFNFNILLIIFPYSVAVTTVGLLVSLITHQIVDDFTNIKKNRN